MDDHIKEVIAETIRELHAENTVQFRRPSTLQGWVYIIIGGGTIGGVLFTFVVFLNRISRHPEEPFHHGAGKLIEELQTKIPSDEKQELQIIKKTEDIRRDIQILREDVGKIQTSVDILVEDSRLDRERPR